MTKRLLLLSALGLSLFSACSNDPTPIMGTGGSNENPQGGTTSSGGASPSGGTTATGGTTPVGTGGVTATGGSAATGGIAATGGVAATGGTLATGGRATGGGVATGGGALATGGSPPVITGGISAATGGSPPTGTGGAGPATGGNRPGTGGLTATGGVSATGGTASATGGAATTTIDCSAAMPTGGTDHCGSNTQGNAGGLAWSLWSNAINANSCITTFNAKAFSARWNNSGDFLARVGLEWGNNGKTYDQYGTISADFSYTRTGTAGGYSYIGIYGWSTNPCVEYYIVDDRWGTMPFNAYNATQKGSATIDGEVYKFFSNTTPGTGGSRCGSSVTTWLQFWSIRQKARQCGTITINHHFDAWKAAGMVMGNMLEAKILVETGGGQGTIEFPVANVTATPK